MKTIDLTVLYHESIASRVYLALLKKKGFRLKKIIEIQVPPNNPKYLLVEKYLGVTLSAYLLNMFRSLKNCSSKSRQLSRQFLNDFGITQADLNKKVDGYALEYETIRIASLDDPTLKAKLEQEKIKTFLFTGGGILKKDILNIRGAKFLHIHPGIVPDVKGADCFFWSCLIKERPGYSVFYMNPGIDTGDIVHSKEFDFSYSIEKFGDYSNDDIYRSILDVYDPALRILTFIELLDRESHEFSDLPYEEQNPEEGRTYFFMHKHLRNFVIDKLKG